MMKRLHISTRLHAALTIVIQLSLVLSGCSARVALPKEDPSRWTACSKIHLLLTDGSEYTVTEPGLQDSTITGAFSPGDRRKVDLDEVASLSVRRPDRPRTVVLVVFGLAAAVVLIKLLGVENNKEPCPT
jgi:hypothetical protein